VIEFAATVAIVVPAGMPEPVTPIFGCRPVVLAIPSTVVFVCVVPVNVDVRGRIGSGAVPVSVKSAAVPLIFTVPEEM
jgi:hypothetical protein